MRSLDLDQFWPMPPRRPGEVHERAQEQPTEASPQIVSVDEALVSHLDPEATAADLIVAASSGWLADGDEPPHSLSAPTQAHGDAASAAEGADAAPTKDTLASLMELPKPAAEAAALREAALAGFAEPPLRPRARRDLTPFVWGGTGFIAGALAWHVVGFWGFVSSVVLNADDPHSKSLEAFLPPIVVDDTSRKATRPISAVGRALGTPVAREASREAQFACVALLSDRTIEGTRQAHCKGSMPLRDAGFNRRADKLVLKPRLQDPIAWTGSTAVQADAEQPSQQSDNPQGTTIETGSLPDNALRLDLSQPETSTLR